MRQFLKNILQRALIALDNPTVPKKEENDMTTTETIQQPEPEKPKLPAPADIEARQTDTEVVSLKWEAVTGAAMYAVGMASPGASTWPEFRVVLPNIGSNEATLCVNAIQTHAFAAVAFDDDGNHSPPAITILAMRKFLPNQGQPVSFKNGVSILNQSTPVPTVLQNK